MSAFSDDCSSVRSTVAYRPFLGHQMAFFSSRGRTPMAAWIRTSSRTALPASARDTARPRTSRLQAARASPRRRRPAWPPSFGSCTGGHRPSDSQRHHRQRQPFGSERRFHGHRPGAGYVDGLPPCCWRPDSCLMSFRLQHFTKNVDVNIQQSTFLHALAGSVFESAENLRQGERHEVVYKNRAERQPGG